MTPVPSQRCATGEEYTPLIARIFEPALHRPGAADVPGLAGGRRMNSSAYTEGDGGARAESVICTVWDRRTGTPAGLIGGTPRDLAILAAGRRLVPGRARAAEIDRHRRNRNRRTYKSRERSQ